MTDELELGGLCTSPYNLYILYTDIIFVTDALLYPFLAAEWFANGCASSLRAIDEVHPHTVRIDHEHVICDSNCGVWEL